MCSSSLTSFTLTPGCALATESRTNPRNLAAGALRSKDPLVTQRAGLSFVAYDLRGLPLATVQDRLTQLEAHQVKNDQTFSTMAPASAQCSEALEQHIMDLLEARWGGWQAS